MNNQYVGAYDTARMRAYESEACRCWSEMMRRGIQAYNDCRMEAADIYLHCAFDIALLRNTCNKNGIFKKIHTTKPAELLLKLMLIEENYNKAAGLLSCLATSLSSEPSHTPNKLPNTFF